MSNKFRLALSALALTAFAVPSYAQPAATTAQPGGVQRADGRSEQMQNNILGTCVIIGNKKEIAALQGAKDKLQHAELKKYAEHMLKDHQAFIEKLRKAGVQEVIPTRDLSSAMENRNSNENEVRQTQATQPAQGTQGGTDQWVSRMLMIEQEVAQQCVTNGRKELEKKNGAEFDKAFVGMQLGAHLAMKDKLQVFHRHATGELRTCLEEGLKTTEHHYEHLIAMMKQLESGKTSSSASSN